MFKNYFTVARRNIWRHKTFSLIQLSGLTLSICVALIVFFIVSHEFSFDKSHKDVDNIYRVTTTIAFGDNSNVLESVPNPMPEAISVDFASVDLVVPVYIENGMITIKPEDDSQPIGYDNTDDIISTNSSYFDMFDYEWLAGSRATALTSPQTVVITEDRAKKYFGIDGVSNALGKTIVYTNDTATVTGVVANLNGNTDLIFKEFKSRAGKTKPLGELGPGDWGRVLGSDQLLIKISPNTSSDQVESQFIDFKKKYYPDFMAGSFSHGLQPFSDIHFNTDLRAFNRPATHKPTMYGLLILAAFLITMGALNYISLSTAQNENRWKEIGVRKTLGGSKQHLVLQFLTEAILLSALGGLFAFLLAPLVTQVFNDYLPEALTQVSIWQLKSFLFILGISLFVGLLSGAFPAFSISKLKPIKLIRKQKYESRKAEFFTRHSLTVMKFMIAQFCIVAVVIVEQQLTFSTNKELGFDRHGIITIPQPGDATESDVNLYLTKLKSMSSFSKVSSSGPSLLSPNFSWVMTYQLDNEEKKILTQTKKVDSTYINFYKLNLIAGSNLDEEKAYERQIIVNETFIKKMGIDTPEEAIGLKLSQRNIVGVVQDFHMSSTHAPIEPLALGDVDEPEPTQNYHLKLTGTELDTKQMAAIISDVEMAWHEVFPNTDLSYSFVDDQVEAFYEKERELSHLLKWSVGMTIFISCLGLLGLALFNVTKRTKEIGIRKVMGASVSNIIMLFSIDSVKPVLIAVVLATPITLYAAQHWLENFTYTMEIQFWMFALPGVMMVGIAFATIGFQVRKAAVANPVESLRDE